MEKILIHLRVPSIEAEMDILVPPDVEIGKLTSVIAGGVRDVSNGHFGVSGREMLATDRPEQLLHPQATLQGYGIQDGATLFLI